MMSNSNSFSFFGIPDHDYIPLINQHHKKVGDSRHGHMLQNFPPQEATTTTIFDPSYINNFSSFVALQNQFQNSSTRSCGDLRGGQLRRGAVPREKENNIHLQEAITTRWSSVESLDCLVSATYTNTDTSNEDDGISSLFSSDGKSLWSYGNSPTQAHAISSGGGESAGHCLGLQTSSSTQLPNHNQAKIQPCFPESCRTLESNRSCKVIEEKYSQNTSISRIQDEHVGSNNLKTVRSCNTARKDLSGHDTSNIATKKRNIGETLGPSYHFLDSDIYSESDEFQLFTENQEKPKKHKSEKCPIINFQQPASTSSGGCGGGEQDSEAIAQMKDIIYGAAAFRPVNLGVDIVEKPKRKNVKISDDPQTVAARQRRERISERIRVLQTLVPGGTKMDTASMLDEAANYLKFLRSRIKELEAFGQWRGFGNYGAAAATAASFAWPPSSSVQTFLHPISAQSLFWN